MTREEVYEKLLGIQEAVHALHATTDDPAIHEQLYAVARMAQRLCASLRFWMRESAGEACIDHSDN